MTCLETDALDTPFSVAALVYGESAGSAAVRFSAQHYPWSTTISVCGDIDAHNADAFCAYVHAMVASGVAPRLILDLSDVGFIAVAGFRALLRIGEECTRAALPWAVIPSDAVNLLLRVADPDRRIPSVASTGEAVQLVTAGRAEWRLPRLITPPQDTRC